MQPRISKLKQKTLQDRSLTISGRRALPQKPKQLDKILDLKQHWRQTWQRWGWYHRWGMIPSTRTRTIPSMRTRVIYTMQPYWDQYTNSVKITMTAKMTLMLTVMKIDLKMGWGVEIERGRSRCGSTCLCLYLHYYLYMCLYLYLYLHLYYNLYLYIFALALVHVLVQYTLHNSWTPKYGVKFGFGWFCSV